MPEVNINIEKSPIPIVWIDTSIITKMTIWKNSPNKLEQNEQSRCENLYNRIYESTRAGNVICPAAEQEGEVWIDRDQWLDTIHTLSLGIECNDYMSIQDIQLKKGMEHYRNKETEINFNYQDIFYEDPVEELKNTLKEPFYIELNNDILFGAEYNKNQNDALLKKLNQQREINVKNKKTIESQLEEEYTGEIEALIQMFRDQMEGNIEDAHYDFNSFWSVTDLYKRMEFWKYAGNDEDDINGFLDFYSSEYNKALPIVDLSCSLYAKIMTDPQPIKSGDSKDIHHISSIMPFADLFITDKAWSAYLNQNGFSTKYNTNVCYIGNTDIINDFFNEINH